MDISKKYIMDKMSYKLLIIKNEQKITSQN